MINLKNDKKLKHMLLLLLPFIMVTTFFGCTKKEQVIIREGETTYVKNIQKKPDKVTPNTAVYAFAWNMKNLNSYRIDVTGTVKAQKGFINYEQSIENFIIKNDDEMYSSSYSNSIVKSIHEAFFKDNNVVYRNSQSGDYTIEEVDKYKEVYGFIPGENLFGYVFNDTTILSSELISSENSYKFLYKLKSSALGYITYQTKAMGNLNDFPEYESVEIYITIDENYMPVSVSITSVYSISIAILGDLKCTQNLSYSFSNINEETNIPSRAELIKLLS